MSPSNSEFINSVKWAFVELVSSGPHCYSNKFTRRSN